MPLVIHHLQVSQSERLPWLCEELEIPYSLVIHRRAPLMSPKSIKDLNPIGQAPVIEDGSLKLAESGACVDYINHVHGKGKLALLPSHQNYPDYLYWFHFANGTLQPHLSSMLQISPKTKESSYAAVLAERLWAMLRLMDDRLKENAWLAGDEFTAADVMTVFSLTTMRVFSPYDMTEYPAILAYLERVVERKAFKAARAKSDPGLELMIKGKPPRSLIETLKAEGKL